MRAIPGHLSTPGVHCDNRLPLLLRVLQHLLVIHLPGDVPHLGKEASERDLVIPDQLSIVKQGLVCVSSQFDALPNCDPRTVCENTVVAKLLAVFPSVFHLAFPPL